MQLTRCDRIMYAGSVEALVYLKENKDALTVLGASFAAVVGAGWAVFKFRKESAKKLAAKPEGGVVVQIGGEHPDCSSGEPR